MGCTNEKFILLSEFGPQIRRAKSTIRRYVEVGLWPPPVVRIGRNHLWLRSEVEAATAAFTSGVNESELRALVSDLVARRGGAA